MAELKLNITHYKILHTVDTLNKSKLYPNNDGVYKLLTGEIDEETESLKDIPTFGTIISYSSKKVSRYILALVRHGYLLKIFDRKSNELYLKISIKGSQDLDKFLKRHKKPYSKTTKRFVQTIANIE